MSARPAQVTPWRATLANALLLSAAYLTVGTAIDALRWWHPAVWVDIASRVIDSPPARALSLTGALPKLRLLYQVGEVPGYALRLLLSSVMVAIIFALSFALAALSWGMDRLLRARRALRER